MKSNEETKEWWDNTYNSMRDSIYVRDEQGILLVYDFSNNRPPVAHTAMDQIEDECIHSFYKAVDKWSVNWKTVKKKLKFEAEGTFNFLPLEEVMQNWDTDFGGNDWAPDMKGFHPFDLFYEMEGHVGFFTGRPDKKGLYLSESDGEAQPLHVDFEGYLKLLALSKGYGWWQNALIEISTGIHQPNTDAFREEMPKIFPEFSWDEFVELYQSVRIDK